MSAAVEKSPLHALAAHVSTMRMDSLPPAAWSAVDSAIRCSLLCVGFGALAERPMAPVPPERIALRYESERDVFGAMAAAVFQATLAGAADLDPLDLGPAHLALPATVAACIAARLWGGDQEAIGDAVTAGMEAGARLRRCLVGVRPGAGLHSAGTFGLFAAAAAVARLLRASPSTFANALAIGLTRAGGLSLNNAATRIGLTHFGWAAAHGLEAGWLAANGLDASTDVPAAFGILFAGSTADFSVATQVAPLLASAPIIFKHYPCNIYLNLVVRALAAESGTGIDEIRIVMPDIRHLDVAKPADLRRARNSAQAVAAAAALYPPCYRSFTAAVFDPAENPALAGLMAAVHVERDPSRATALDSAAIDVEAGRGGERVVRRSLRMAELTPWSRDHAQVLAAGIGPPSWIAQVYDGTYMDAYRTVAGFIESPGDR